MLTTYGEKIRCMTASLVILTNLLRSDSRLDVSSLKELSTLFSFFSTKAMEEEDSSFGYTSFFFLTNFIFSPISYCIQTIRIYMGIWTILIICGVVCMNDPVFLYVNRGGSIMLYTS